MTIQLTFTPEIQEALHYERYHHPVPLVQRRMETLWLKSHDLPMPRLPNWRGSPKTPCRITFGCIRKAAWRS